MASVSPVLAERDPSIIRWFPTLSRTRRLALSRIEQAIEADMVLRDGSFQFDDDHNFKHLFRSYSSRTLHMIADNFAEAGPDGIVSFISSEKGRYPESNEMRLRAIISYKRIIESVINEPILGGYRPRTQRVFLDQIVGEAAWYHTDFMRHEDLSAIAGETRARFEAVLTVLCGTALDEGTFSRCGQMSPELASLTMSRPDRAHDIVKYQQDRGMPLRDMDAAAVSEFLDDPSPVLAVGVL